MTICKCLISHSSYIPVLYVTSIMSSTLSIRFTRKKLGFAFATNSSCLMLLPEMKICEDISKAQYVNSDLDDFDTVSNMARELYRETPLTTTTRKINYPLPFPLEPWNDFIHCSLHWSSSPFHLAQGDCF
ncbi:hypothetical protein RclHR1_07720002 [Rhizophagus clarus]|uniref:Uncharacterized protein n=1 Tax=Rhizophagus clarus TaxID=94130 RepID=A0A2Z6RXL7_9GLOM|nr:hypothetical protein RclHR1_07720002 [Rhizophagus clarus]